MEIDGDNAMVRHGNMVVEAPVKVEQASAKFSNTSVRYAIEVGTYRLAEIMVRGTTSRIIFTN